MVGIVRDKDNKEIKRVQNPSRDWMVKQLNENVCQVLFKKKLNGQFRSLKCTRSLKKLPRKYKLETIDDIQNPHGYVDLIPVWDISSRDWKSYYHGSVYIFTVLLGEI